MDQVQQRAMERMALRSPDECVMAIEGQNNAGGVRKVDTVNGSVYYDSAPLTEYPRMMYRKTDAEKREAQTGTGAKCGESSILVNNYGTAEKPLLCETRTANDADEAELLTADGWDTSARAAHGLTDGLAKVASVKDARIAELEAQLAAREDLAVRDEMAGVKPLHGTLKPKLPA